ncbi:MAG TPA: hypothetical protein VFE63_11205 [Roseiarcus sp.]|jgi:hypothetical protein|nr:hypothetical protein [Roseiarcus sp.]
MLLVLAHLAGVALASVRRRENLVGAMIAGAKRAAEPSDVRTGGGKMCETCEVGAPFFFATREAPSATAIDDIYLTVTTAMPA